jgi:hypothetical protein
MQVVVKCLVDCRLTVSGVDVFVEDEFIGGRLYVLEDDKNIIGEHGNRIPIVGFRYRFKPYRPNKRKSKWLKVSGIG